MNAQTSRSQALRAGLSRDAKGRPPQSPWGATDASAVNYLAHSRGNSQGGKVTLPSGTLPRTGNGNGINGKGSHGTNGTNGTNGQNGNGNGNGNGLTTWGTIHPVFWLAAGGMFLWFWNNRKK